MKNKISSIVFLLLLTLFFSCTEKQITTIHGDSMGTYYNIVYVGKEDSSLTKAVDSLLINFSKQFSIFDSTSTISMINRENNILLDDEIIDLFLLSKNVSEKTDGAFDITVGPLVELWGFGNNRENKITQNEIDSVKQWVGFDKISLSGNKLIKKYDNMTLNFNAIAKGYATDLLTNLLELRGYKNFIVEIGGEVVAKGKKIKDNWRVGIQVPTKKRDDAIESFYTFELENLAVATSGNYRNYQEINGTRYSHIINPATGWAEKSNLLSVTVVANHCALADAYATAFMVMGVEKSLLFLENHPELAAFFIFTDKNGDFKTIQTDNFPSCIKN
jgi:thiamine biosynthesis lipoprotein